MWPLPYARLLRASLLVLGLRRLLGAGSSASAMVQVRWWCTFEHLGCMDFHPTAARHDLSRQELGSGRGPQQVEG